MLELIGTAASAILGGGATGILGAAVQRYADYKGRQLDLQAQASKQAHEVAMREADARIMAQEWAARTQVATIEGDAREVEADAKTLAASYQMEPQHYSGSVKPTRGQGWLLVLLDVLRGVVRPGLTIYLCVLTTQIYNELAGQVGPLTADQRYETTKLIVGTILYLFTTVTLWWFGTRSKGAQPK